MIKVGGEKGVVIKEGTSQVRTIEFHNKKLIKSAIGDQFSFYLLSSFFNFHN